MAHSPTSATQTVFSKMTAMPMGSPLIECRNLKKSFGPLSVVKNLNLTLKKGECFGLLGPNGAGKSTTIRMILGHVKPDSGTIHMGDVAVDAYAHELRRHIGVVAQFDSLDPDFSVQENLIMYARYFGINRATIEQELPQLLDFAMLTQRANANVMELSGGMRRRLSVARALVNHPLLMVLDEPTTGLDPQARHLLWDRLKLLKKQGMTLLLTTHFMDEAERLCDRIGIMDGGRLVAEGSPRTLIEQTIASDVVEFYGEDLQAVLPPIQALLSQASNPAERGHIEVSGETCFCYVHNVQPLLQLAQQLTQMSKNQKAPLNVRYLHRPAHLEDVFLRLTGRDLRDD